MYLHRSLMRALFLGSGLSFGLLSSAADFVEVQPDLFSSPGAVVNAWADYDNDGDLDLLVTFDSGEVRLYENDDGVFRNVGPDVGLPVQGNSVRGAAWGDYDGDGYVDLYLGSVNWQGPASNRLYRNESGRRFVDVTDDVGLRMINVTSRQVCWVDFDNDGDLDLFVAQRTGWNRLFRNDDGKFVDVSEAVGLYDPRRTVGSVWFDFDQDGDLDLFNANQSGDRDAFYRNDGGKFVDIAMELGLDSPRRPITEGSVASSVADFDNDGDFDLFVGTYGVNRLYRNDGGGRFVDVASSLGITADDHIVGSSWGDYDLDGRVDLFLTGYMNGVLNYKDYLFRNTPTGFVDSLPDNIAKKDGDHSVQWADYDQDGDLDLALTSNHSKGTHSLFRNELRNEYKSIQVLVLDMNGHYTKAGAEVRVYDNRGGRLLGSRIVDTGGGYGAQNAMPVHFGLGHAESVDIEVTSMSSNGRIIKLLENVDPADYANGIVVVKVR